MRRYDIKDDAVLAEVRAMILAISDRGASDASIQEKLDATRWIVDAVRKNGDAAVAELTERYDGVALEPAQFEVTEPEIQAALGKVDARLMGILERAHDNIRRFHSQFLRESWQNTDEDGTILGQRITPIESAGVYVPGGKAFYPSSVLMNIVPARVAGVKEIVMVSPPSYEGSIHPAVLAAARIAGATRIFRIGGAQSVAALAYGTETIPAVTKITGPGNTFVTAAKALVRGVVEIDSEAGPSEVVVLADESANAEHVAAELLAQAEHDEEAMCVVITPSAEVAEKAVKIAMETGEKLSRSGIIMKSLKNHGVAIVTRDLEEAISLTNLYAAEHLSVQTERPLLVAEKIKNAGAMMLGDMTPVAVGDYYAGPNHILPTERRARFSSPLTAEDFRKVTSILYYSKERLTREAADIETFATVEELEAHARSVTVRVPKEDRE